MESLEALSSEQRRQQAKQAFGTIVGTVVMIPALIIGFLGMVIVGGAIIYAFTFALRSIVLLLLNLG